MSAKLRYFGAIPTEKPYLTNPLQPQILDIKLSPSRIKISSCAFGIRLANRNLDPLSQLTSNHAKELFSSLIYRIGKAGKTFVLYGTNYQSKKLQRLSICSLETRKIYRTMWIVNKYCNGVQKSRYITFLFVQLQVNPYNKHSLHWQRLLIVIGNMRSTNQVRFTVILLT